MKLNAKLIITILFLYVVAQFLWWEVLMVRQLNEIMQEKQKILALTISDPQVLEPQLLQLESSRLKRTYMIVGEGTIFLLLLLFGVRQVYQANKKENDLLRQKNNFLLSVTHELKTPLATMKLQIQTLQKHHLTQEKKQELLSSALQENNRLNSLIDNILLAALLQKQDFALSTEKLNPAELIKLVANTHFKTMLDDARVRLFLDEEIYCNIDRMAFQSVLINLMDNAIKYSAEYISIQVRLFKKEGKAIIQVADEGIGIADEEKQKVFEQFYRSGNEDTRKSKGAGLGLYIVKYIVEKHRGTISVFNNAPRGTVFQVALDCLA